MKLYFATSNNHKVLEFRKFFEPHGVEIEQINIEIPEIRDDDVAVVAREKAKYAAMKTKRTVVVEDTGLYISALKGFPGTCAKFVFFTIGYEGVLKLLKGANNRKAEFRTAIAMVHPGKEPQIFVGAEKGTIIEEPRGSGGFGYDPVFLPDGSKKTYAEMNDAKYNMSHRAKALSKFAEFLEKERV